MGRDGLHEPRWSHFVTEVVVSIRGQPIIAINEGDEGERFRQAGELQLLRVKTRIHKGYLLHPFKGAKRPAPDFSTTHYVPSFKTAAAATGIVLHLPGSCRLVC